MTDIPRLWYNLPDSLNLYSVLTALQEAILSEQICNACKGTGKIDPDIHLTRGDKEKTLCGIPRPGRTRRTADISKATCTACLTRAAVIEANREAVA